MFVSAAEFALAAADYAIEGIRLMKDGSASEPFWSGLEIALKQDSTKHRKDPATAHAMAVMGYIAAVALDDKKAASSWYSKSLSVWGDCKFNNGGRWNVTDRMSKGREILNSIYRDDGNDDGYPESSNQRAPRILTAVDFYCINEAEVELVINRKRDIDTDLAFTAKHKGRGVMSKLSFRTLKDKAKAENTKPISGLKGALKNEDAGRPGSCTVM
jgi:hypothetical protein